MFLDWAEIRKSIIGSQSSNGTMYENQTLILVPREKSGDLAARLPKHRRFDTSTHVVFFRPRRRLSLAKMLELAP